MEWHELFDSLAGRLQEGWPQVVRTIQDGDFGELLQQPAMIMAAAGIAPTGGTRGAGEDETSGTRPEIHRVCIDSRNSPADGSSHQGVHALVVPKRGVSELSP